jgi:hypothetical protein
MKFSPKSVALAVIAAAALSGAALSLTSCSAPTGYSYSNIGITMTAYCSDCPAINYNPAYPQAPAAGNVLYMPPGGGQGGVYQLTVHVTNAPASSATWAIYPSPNLTLPNPPASGTSLPISPGTSSVGVFTTPDVSSPSVQCPSGGNPPPDCSETATGASVFYQNNGTPIYTGAALQQAQALGIPQGDVLIVVSVPNDPANPSSMATYGQLIQMYNGSTTPTLYMVPTEPTLPSGTTTSVAQVPRNGTFQFYGGAAGEVPCVTTPCANGLTYPLLTADNDIVWRVGQTAATATNTCNNPSDTKNQPASACPYGWISAAGLYTAPATLPAQVSPLVTGQVVIVMASDFLPNIIKTANISVF